MKTKLNHILLIDDDEPTNFLNMLIIKEAMVAENICALQSAKHALDILSGKLVCEGCPSMPDLILLDINMPVLNGWDFLDEFIRLANIDRNTVKIVVLTSSDNPEDREKAHNRSEVSGFLVKPLTEDIIRTIIEKHFTQ